MLLLFNQSRGIVVNDNRFSRILQMCTTLRFSTKHFMGFYVEYKDTFS